MGHDKRKRQLPISSLLSLQNSHYEEGNNSKETGAHEKAHTSYTYTHNYLSRHLSTQKQIRIHTDIYAYSTLAHTQTCICMHTHHMHLHIHTDSHRHTRKLTYTLIYMHTRTYTNTHIHCMHIHIHKQTHA